MNILWLSWRDIKNPKSGGAEKVAIEVSKRFIRDGSNVTIFTSSFKQSKPHEKINGVNIIRRGNQLTCRLHAFLHYRKNPNFDLIIDEINTIPFFSNFYAKSKSVCFIHQLAKEYWHVEVIWPFNLIGHFLEPILLKTYKKIPTITVSPSTQKDLKSLGFKNIYIIRQGLDFKPTLLKEKSDIILFIGRLTKAKQPLDAINAFNEVSKQFPKLKLIILGTGEAGYINELKKTANKLNLKKSINFKGFVSESEKITLLKKAKLILIPSIREGWGLVATEASASGCIPVAYNVPGLRDSIRNGTTGLLTKPNPKNLADTAIKLLLNTTQQKTLAKNGLLWAKQFNFEKTYQSFKKIIVSN